MKKIHKKSEIPTFYLLCFKKWQEENKNDSQQRDHDETILKRTFDIEILKKYQGKFESFAICMIKKLSQLLESFNLYI